MRRTAPGRDRPRLEVGSIPSIRRAIDAGERHPRRTGKQDCDSILLRRRRNRAFQFPPQRRAIVAWGAIDDFLNDLPAFQEFTRHIEIRVDLLPNLICPRPVEIGKRLNAIIVGGVLVEDDCPGPPVIVDVEHFRFLPFVVVAPAILNDCRDHVVTVTKDVGTDLKAVANFTLHRIATTIDLGPDVFDQYAARRRTKVCRASKVCHESCAPPAASSFHGSSSNRSSECSPLHDSGNRVSDGIEPRDMLPSCFGESVT